MATEATKDLSRIMDIHEASDYLGISEVTMYRLVKSNKLVYLKIGQGRGTYRFRQSDLDEYLERLAAVYFDKVSRRTRVILNFIQPALLILCAGVLLFIVSAFIVPVYSNLSNIAGGNINF